MLLHLDKVTVNLAPITQKYKNLLHEKMLVKCTSYRNGYEFGLDNQEHFEKLGVEGLEIAFQVYINQHTYFSAGLARLCWELIREKLEKAVAC